MIKEESTEEEEGSDREPIMKMALAFWTDTERC
jgi:hypothetical protein